MKRTDTPDEGKPGPNADRSPTASPRGWEHLTSASAELLGPPRKAALLASTVMVVLFVSALVWANFARLEEVTRGDGRVIPARKTQVVQNLEGGIVKAIRAKVGDRVAKGQILFRIDATASGSSLYERLDRISGMEAKLARLTAEVEGIELTFSERLSKAYPEFVKQERRLYLTRRREYQAAIRVLTQQIAQRRGEVTEAMSQKLFAQRILKKIREEIELTLPLLKSKLTSKADFIKLETRELELQRDIRSADLKAQKARQALEEAHQRLTERESRFKAEAQTELNKVQVELSALKNAVKAFRDRVARTSVRSPVDGIIKDVRVTSVGQVVKSGIDLAEIVPVEDSLLIEANIKPSDIAFLRPGQSATIKITAYDYTIYGSLNGTLEQIGADTLNDDKGTPFYRILVRAKRNYLTRGDKRHPIIPGMIAQVDLQTGQKTVLQYILRPIERLTSSSLRER
jgi:adhesin transport system membrane fusion protein